MAEDRESDTWQVAIAAVPKGLAERLAGMSRCRPDDSSELWPWSTIHGHAPSPHPCAAKAEHTANTHLHCAVHTMQDCSGSHDRTQCGEGAGGVCKPGI